jgi:excisionase family DNA binding protein
MGLAGASPRLLSDYLTAEQLAEELRISSRTLARWRALDEAPPAVRVGRRILYRRSTVAAWLAHRERASLA